MKFFSTLVAATLGTLIALGIVVVFLFMFVFAIAASSDTAPQVRDGSLLVAEISGSIPEQVSGDPLAQLLADEPSVDVHGIKQALRKAAADDRIVGLWLKVGTTSIGWETMYEIRASVERFKESGKPVFASSDDFVDTEAEYYLMSAADSVYGAPGGIFEFNGFAIVGTFYRGLLDKLEVKPQLIRAGSYKSAGETFLRTDFSDANDEQLRAILNVQEALFLETIASARGLRADSLRRLASEDAILTVDDAVEAGLVTGLLHADEIVNRWKQLLEVEAEKDLKTVSLTRYARVPAGSAGLKESSDSEIAIVYAEGTIVGGTSGEESPIASGLLGSKSLAKSMRRARESKSVKAVVLRVNSPGGFAPAADAMLREIELTAAEKPLVVSMGSLAASGGYWISTAADTIVASPLTITGSIGVFSLFFDLGDFFEDKLGVTFDNISSSPYADMFTGVRPLSASEQVLLQELTDETYSRFLQLVSDGRGLSNETVRDVAEGRVWIGKDAAEKGLVDVLGDLDTAVEIAAGLAELDPESVRIRTLPRPRSFLERMTRSMEAQALNGWLKLMGSESERRLLRHARTLGRAIADFGTVQARVPFDIVIR